MQFWKEKKVSPDTYKLYNNHGVKINIGDNLTYLNIKQFILAVWKKVLHGQALKTYFT